MAHKLYSPVILYWMELLHFLHSFSRGLGVIKNCLHLLILLIIFVRYVKNLSKNVYRCVVSMFSYFDSMEADRCSLLVAPFAVGTSVACWDTIFRPRPRNSSLNMVKNRFFT